MATIQKALTEEVDKWKDMAQSQIKSLQSQAQPYLNVGASLIDPTKRAELVQSITIESQLFPPIRLDKPFVAKPPIPIPPALEAGKTALTAAQQAAQALTLKRFGEIAKPRITIEVQGVPPLTATPFGKPTARYWEDAINWGKIAAVAFGVFVIFRVARKRKCICTPS